MKRGFLNTPRSRAASHPEEVEKVRDSVVPRAEEGPRGEEKAVDEAAQDKDTAIDVEMTTVEDVSSAPSGNRVIAVRTTRSIDQDGTESPSLGGDHKTSAEAEPPSVDHADKGKAKDTGDDGPMNTDIQPDNNNNALFLPTRLPPRRPGWGRDPNEDIYHTVPPSHGGPHRKRAVFRLWPRDPNGKPLMPSDQPRGTLSPDGYPWGATLYDFYNVHRIPSVDLAISVMTGSALAAAMKEMGEVDAAALEIAWAKSEGEPRVVGVANTEELIQSVERRLQLRAYWKFSMREDVRRLALPVQVEDAVDEDEDKQTSEDDGEDERKLDERNKQDEKKEDGGESREETNREDNNDDHKGEDAPEEMNQKKEKVGVKSDDGIVLDPAFIPPPPMIPVTSPFHPSHYPKPWPFIPFENPLSILLQERIPLHLLPKTLYVHDPFFLLSACDRKFRDNSWTSRPDIIRKYGLGKVHEVRKVMGEARKAAEDLEEFKSRTLIILRYKRTEEQIANNEPAIEIPLPPYPRRMTSVEESHLYLSPVGKVGSGHHSIVYKGEWELPRELFTRPKICPRCFRQAADEEIQRLKDTGRWEKLLKAARWGATGATGSKPLQEELDEASDPVKLERDGEIIERVVTCGVPPGFTSPSQLLEMLDEDKFWNTFMAQKNANTVYLDFTTEWDEDKDGDEPPGDSYVATIRIDPQFTYESQKTCNHGPRRLPVPRTSKFTVVAKLSIEDDDHLSQETSNYRQFPEHFFHHYNGYTLIDQLHSVVPVHAVVPQFYGYYVPIHKWEGGCRVGPYVSPILLLEHCGEPIDPEKLSDEDQDECASLLLRFQRAGWLHDSVAKRNILVQRGKPTEFPFERECNPELSFRLIDFGRSRKFERIIEKQIEEREAISLFKKLKGKMSVTLLA